MESGGDELPQHLVGGEEITDQRDIVPVPAVTGRRVVDAFARLEADKQMTAGAQHPAYLLVDPGRSGGGV